MKKFKLHNDYEDRPSKKKTLSDKRSKQPRNKLIVDEYSSTSNNPYVNFIHEPKWNKGSRSK